jgi:hypothetical protein
MKTTNLLLAALLVALPASAAERVTVGTFEAGEAYEPPADRAPARVSRAYVRTVAVTDGAATVELPVAGGQRVIVWTVANGADAASSIRTPGGRGLASGEAKSADGSVRRVAVDSSEMGLDLPGAQEALEVRDAEPGRYLLDVSSPGAAALSVVVAEPDSPLALTTWAGPLSLRPGQPLVLGASLRDGREPVGARIQARLAGPDGKAGAPVELFDDGRHQDGAAGDGAFGARVDGATFAPGFWSVRFDAAGDDARGIAFERTGSSGFMSESGAAVLGAATAVAGRGLRVSADADVRMAGRYRLDVIVATLPDADGRQDGVAWAESTLVLAQGRAPLAVTVPAASLGTRAGQPLFVDVRLVGLDAPGVSRVTTTTAEPALDASR